MPNYPKKRPIPNGGEDQEQEAAGGPAKMNFFVNVGVQLGLTDVTSDTALKFQGTLEF